MMIISIPIEVYIECLILNRLADINKLWNVILACLILFRLMHNAKHINLKLNAEGNAKACRILIVLIILSLMLAEYTEFNRDFDIAPLMMSYYLVMIASALIECRGETRKMTQDEIKQYEKLYSMQTIALKGLNIHKFYPCRTFSELWRAYIELGDECTIRTDKKNVGQGRELKFYIAKNESLSGIKKIADEIHKDNCIAIISNGLKYDKYLRYNLVYKIKEDGSFICEYSRRRVPLRHMYRYGKELNSITGNIDDSIRDWNVKKAENEDGRVDLREIREVIRNAYKVGIYNRYVEMSAYSENCGIQNKKEVYWEI